MKTLLAQRTRHPEASRSQAATLMLPFPAGASAHFFSPQGPGLKGIHIKKSSHLGQVRRGAYPSATALYSIRNVSL